MCWENFRQGTVCMQLIYSFLCLLVLGGPTMFAVGTWLLASPHTVVIHDVITPGSPGVPAVTGPGRYSMDQNQRDSGIALAVVGFLLTALALTAMLVLCCRPIHYNQADEADDVPPRWNTANKSGHQQFGSNVNRPGMQTTTMGGPMPATSTA